MVGKYVYDAWGNHTITVDVDGIATLNPFRYRGYYYDVETGLYYVKSRYYDPATGRFINADGYVSTGQDLDGFNMYAYCGNNPIVNTDSFGTRHVKGIDACGGAGNAYTPPLDVNIFIPFADLALEFSNYVKNSQLESGAQTTLNKKINDQKSEDWYGYKYGFCNVSYNGCEAIAIHNAKLLKGIDSTLTETISDLQNENAMMLYGVFGSNPYKIGDVLDTNGITYHKVSSPDSMTMYGTYIISYWTGYRYLSSIHTIAVSHTSAGYTAYNYGGKFDPATIKRYICGYYLE